MIFSDHFVRFYNEVFKFLDERNGLDGFYEAISHEQARASAKLFWEKGLRGVKEHFDRIYKEENCTNENWTTDIARFSSMTNCPSLTKATDNDAGLCEKYCLHCPGWEIPLLTRCGIYIVYDLDSLHSGNCREFKAEYKKDAEEFLQKILAEGANPDMIRSNLDKADEVEAYRQRRLRGEPMPKELFE